MPTAARLHRLSARIALWWLAACLVLGPALGRMHQVLHGPLASAAAMAQIPFAAPGSAAAWLGAASPAPAHTVHHGSVHGGHGSVHALFQGHGDADCELLDQLLFGGALLPAPLAVASLATASPPQDMPSEGIDARHRPAFLARAPPALLSA